MAFQLSKPLQPRADCPEKFELIRSWLSKCDKHPLCSRVPLFAPEPRLPTCLIDLGVPENQDDLRLISSGDLDQSNDCRYVALSHCWGAPGKVPKTHTNTLQKQQEKITELSKTFRDAIQVTREIGVRYLWIDSICIIQDDASDFNRECAIMHLVYAHAYCVLSAQDARDSDDGLFLPRDPELLRDAETFEWETEALAGPLSTRGWAFQEHQLSTRMIHFTTLRILWECRGSYALEDRPGLIYRSLMSPRRGTISLTADADEKANSMTPTKALTFSSDKLPAISGLASAMAALTGDTAYLAGIWESDMIRGVLWRSTRLDGPCRLSQAHNYSASLPLIPTWSWASITSGVRFLLVLHEANDRNPYTVRKYTGSVMIRPRSDGAKLQLQVPPSGLGTYGIIATGFAQEMKLQNDRLLSVEPMKVQIWLDNDIEPKHCLETLFLVLLTFRERHLYSSSWCSFGLILMIQNTYIYRRIGAFRLDGDLPAEFKEITVTIA